MGASGLRSSFNTPVPPRDQDAFLKAIGDGDNALFSKFLRLYGDAILDKRDRYGNTPLMRAAGRGHKDMVETLLDRGADISQKNHEGWTVLIFAAKGGHNDVIELLLEKGVVVDEKSRVGRTALTFAAAEGKTDTVEFLLAKGAVIDETANNGRTALTWAAQNGHTATVGFLLEKGAVPGVKSNDGYTAAAYAQNFDKPEVAALLEKRFLDDTDCSKGLRRSMPVPHLIGAPRKP